MSKKQILASAEPQQQQRRIFDAESLKQAEERLRVQASLIKARKLLI